MLKTNSFILLQATPSKEALPKTSLKIKIPFTCKTKTSQPLKLQLLSLIKTDFTHILIHLVVVPLVADGNPLTSGTQSSRL